MREEYKDLWRKISDDEIFIVMHWYPYPKKELFRDFVEWYYKETGNIEFSEGKTHFRLLYTTTKAGRDKFLNPVPAVVITPKIAETIKIESNIDEDDEF